MQSMSKYFQPFLVVTITVGLSVLASIRIRAQDFEATITIHAQKPNIAHVSGRRIHEVDVSSFFNFSFVGMYPGIPTFPDRFSNIGVNDKSGKAVGVKRVQTNAFDAQAAPWSWSYDVDLTPIKAQAAAAHLSWFNGDHGILMPI